MPAALVTRTYTAALSPDDPAALWCHHQATNIAVGAAVDDLATLIASVVPGATPDDPERRRRWHLLTALSWLSVESAHSAPEAHVIDDPSRSGAELTARLVKILTALGENDVDAWVDDCRTALSAPIREDAVWVDRRAMWATGVLDLPGWGVMRDLVVNSEEAPASLPATARRWWSTSLGHGRPGNWGALEALTSRLLEQLRTAPPTMEDLAGAVLERPGGAGPALSAAFRAEVPGRPSQLANLLARLGSGPLGPDDLDKLRHSASAYLDTCHAHLSARAERSDAESEGLRTAAQALQGRMEAASGITYRLDPYCELLVQALSVVVARRAKLCSRITEWLDAEAEAGRAERALASEPRLALDRYCAARTASTAAAGPYRISGRASRRLRRVVGAWGSLDDEGPRLDALAGLEAEDPNLGDHHLYAWLAAQPRSVVDAAVPYQHWHARLCRLERLKVPCLTAPHPLRAPRFTWFGAMKWHRRLSPSGELELTVWDGSGYRAVGARWSSGRISGQLGAGDGGGVVVTRDDRRSRAAAGADAGEMVSVPVRFDTAAVQLRFDRSRLAALPASPPPELVSWSVAIAFRLRPATACGPARGMPGHRVLGVDLGIRRDASLAVMEVVDDTEVAELAAALSQDQPGPDASAWRARQAGLGRTRTYRRLATHGSLPPHWARLVDVEGVDLSGPGAWASDAQRRCLVTLTSLLDGTWLAPELAAAVVGPKVHRSGLLEATFALLGAALDGQSWLARTTTGLDDPLGRVPAAAPNWPLPLEVAQDRDPVAAASQLWAERDVALGQAIGLARRVVLAGENQGLGLSLRRVSELDRLYRLERRYHSRPRPGGQVAEPVAEGFGAQLARKRLAVRRQWSVQVGGAIVDAALRHGCHAVVLEDLSRFAPAQSRARADNRLLRRWAHRSLTATVASLCELHGLTVVSVNPAGTSRLDARSGAPAARWQRVPLADAARIKASTWWARQLADAERGWLEERRRRHVLDVDALLAAATHRPAQRRISIDVPDPRGQLLAPEDAKVRSDGRGGWLVEGAADADLSAAVNIAARGAGIHHRRRTPVVASG